MSAPEPWSGTYTIQPPIYIVAHTTQFSQPGWFYLGGQGSAYFQGVSYVTLANKQSNGQIDFSIIIESIQSGTSQMMVFVLSNIPDIPKSLSVWRTNETDWFIKQDPISVKGNSFTLYVEPLNIYTITTTSGQSKAKDPTISVSKPFPLPYSDTFDEYPLEATVKYFSDQGGSWTTRPDPTNSKNMVFTQVVTTQPILWHWCSSSIDPITLIGYNKYSDYSITVNALLTEVKQGVYVAVSGRIGPDSFDARRYGFPPGYTFQVESTGNWVLWKGTQSGTSTSLAKGVISFTINQWHNLGISFKGNNIAVTFDGQQISTNTDQTYTRGLVSLGSGFHYAYFDKFDMNSL